MDVTFNQISTPGKTGFSSFANAVFSMLIWAIGTDESDWVGLALKDATSHIAGGELFSGFAKDKDRLLTHLTAMSSATKNEFWENAGIELILIVLRKWAEALGIPVMECLESLDGWNLVMNKECNIDFVENQYEVDDDFTFCVCISSTSHLIPNVF